jgi:hypothetical protein
MLAQRQKMVRAAAVEVNRMGAIEGFEEAPVFPARRFGAVTLMLLAGAVLAVLFPAAQAWAQGSTGACGDAAQVTVLPSPIAPWKGVPLRVLLAAEKPLEGELSLIAPDGSVGAKSGERHGGPPYYWIAEVASPAAGTWHATLTRDGAPAGCGPISRDITVHAVKPPAPGSAAGSVWPLRNSWNRETENLYSAWIAKLFDDPLDAEPSWPALHEVLRDRSRNFLHNYLGLNEDGIKMVLRPDCADLPYFLRTYFSFKLGLPFGYSKCTRGGGGNAPRCPQWFNIHNLEPPPAPPAQAAAPPKPAPSGFAALYGRVAADEAPEPAAPAPPRHLGLVPGFGAYLQIVADAVHSGSARTALADNNTDQYPVPLTRETLRPGTIYADPYGHVLTIVRFIPQSPGEAGIILAVDGQPDGTVARKRFWRGNFLFAQDPALGGPGFKRFRPIVAARNGALHRLSNDEIAKDPQYGDFSLEQAKLGMEDFYDRMDDVMSPSPLDPVRAEKEAITSLEEQVKVRVNSVDNGRKFLASGKGEASMPEGAHIFETTGAWEDFSTPSRDLRLLIALDVVEGFPDRVARRPERYAMPQGKSVADVKAELQRVLAAELAARKFSYTRSDGTPWTLVLKDVTDRATDLEMAYNPNDCVELRWGAPNNSDEASTCKRHAPAAQHTKMASYRAWFHERRRPPRP